MVAKTMRVPPAWLIATLVAIALQSSARFARAQQTEPGTPVFEAVGYGVLRPWGPSGNVLAVAKREADVGGGAEFTVISLGPGRIERWKVTLGGVPYFAGFVPTGLVDVDRVATWADMNGDGAADLLCAVWVSGAGPAIEIFTMGPGGPITPGQLVPVAVSYVAHLMVADVNSDGRPDIGVVSYSGGLLTWFLNQGTGAFLPVSSGVGFGRPVTAQLGSDGFVDMVDWDPLSLNIGISAGAGNGAFPSPTLRLESTGRPLVSDLDHDGQRDIVAGRFLYRGVSDGPPVKLDSVATSATAMVDVDHDGTLDLVSVLEGKVGVAHGLGGFEFAPYTQVPAGTIDDRYGWGSGDMAWGPFGMSAVMDANGDGWVDVVGSCAHPTGIWPQEIAGRVLYSVPGRPGGGFHQLLHVPTGSDPVQVALSDILGTDGRPDLIVLARGARRLEIRPGAGDGTFGPAQYYDLPPGGVKFALADLNDDSRTDVVVACDSTAVLRVFAGTGSGLDAPFDLTTPAPNFDVVIADIDEDGHLDLLSRPQYCNLAAWRGDGAMGFVSVPWGSNTPFCDHRLRVADVDGDGHLDLVTMQVSVLVPNYLQVHRGDGAGHFTIDYRYTRYGLCGAQIETGDLLGDGRTHVAYAVVDSSQITYSFFRAFTGEGGVMQTIPEHCELEPPGGCAWSGYQVAPNPKQLAIADVTGDHIPDVVVLSAAGSVLTVLPGLGGGQFGTQIEHIVGRDPSSFALGDVDGDGDLDVMVADLATDDVTLMRNLGSATAGVRPAIVDGGLRMKVESAPNASQLRLRLTLPGAGPARVEFFDLLGRRLAQVPVEATAAGEQHLTIDGARLAGNGVYFARLSQGSAATTARFMRFR